MSAVEAFIPKIRSGPSAITLIEISVMALSLNGENLTVSVGAPLPSLTGAASRGDSVTLPARDVCVAGFVEAVYAEPVMACM